MQTTHERKYNILHVHKKTLHILLSHGAWYLNMGFRSTIVKIPHNARSSELVFRSCTSRFTLCQRKQRNLPFCERKNCRGYMVFQLNPSLHALCKNTWHTHVPYIAPCLVTHTKNQRQRTALVLIAHSVQSNILMMVPNKNAETQVCPHTQPTTVHVKITHLLLVSVKRYASTYRHWRIAERHLCSLAV